jgi:hypothetical protein
MEPGTEAGVLPGLLVLALDLTLGVRDASLGRLPEPPTVNRERSRGEESPDDMGDTGLSFSFLCLALAVLNDAVELRGLSW